MNPSSQIITYGNEAITYAVNFSDRRTLDIAVHPDAQVIVTAPIGADLEAIQSRVKRRARWILKQQRYFSQFEPRTPPRQYVSGETHLYLGRQYRLKVERHPTPSVKLKGRYLHVQTHEPECTDITYKLLESWYRERAQVKFNERLDCCFAPFKGLGCSPPRLLIRRLSKRWGSLSPAGTMSLNYDLVRAPSGCIDYVITHELCHLKHPNHSRDFYEFLSVVMPNWERRKCKLENLLA